MNSNASTLDVRVSSKWVEATEICGVELIDVGGGNLPSFSPGSHIDVYLPNGLVRQYSLCNAPGERHRYVLGVLRSVSSRGGSSALHDMVREGDILRVGVPRNSFPLVQGAREAVFFAGGIGITPILCMMERLAEENRPFETHYCARSQDRTAFSSRIRASKFRDNVHFHFDDGPPAQMLNLKERLRLPVAGVHIYVCGPKGFMDAIVGCAQECGWQDDQIHYESFEPDFAPKEGDRSFDVRIASSGLTINIPADKKVTKVLEEHGIVIPTSCSQGLCGTCLTRVLDGEPDHRDVYLTLAEREQNRMFLPCCSRAKSELLVLDL